MAAAGLTILLTPSVASASWWDGGYGGYQPHRREQPPNQPPPDQGQPSSTTTTQPPPQESPDQPPPSGGYGGEQPPSGDYGGEQPTTTTRPAPQQPPSCCYGGPQPAPAPAPAPPPRGSIYGCENSDIPGTRLALHKETTPSDGTPVHPGDEILVEITWRVTDWVAPDLHKALDCVYINNRYVPGLSGGERPTPNDGHFAWRYVVPADVPPGSTICDHGFVSGPNGSEDYGREVSDIVCFPVEQPPPPTPPTTTATTAPPTTTTTEQPESERITYEAPAEITTTTTPPAASVLPRQRTRELPRTGGDSTLARLASWALGLALLGRAGIRRRAGDPHQ
jgi:hypothetical protein